jgi:acyl-coenzyme A thioesterase PaaI-like protein
MTRKQANSKHCFVCGVDNFNGLKINFYEDQPGSIHASVTVPAHFQGYPGIVHGGVIAAMLDEVAGRCIIDSEPPRWMVTAKLSIRYRRPVPVEAPLKLFGTLKEDSGSLVKTAGEIRDESGIVLAEAEVILANVPPQLKNSMAHLSNDEWQVYPDEAQS